MGDKAPTLPVLISTIPPEIFAAELTAVEDIGPCVRLVFTVPRQSGSEAFREPTVNVIVPATICSAMAMMLMQEPRQIRRGEPEATFEDDTFGAHKPH